MHRQNVTKICNFEIVCNSINVLFKVMKAKREKELVKNGKYNLRAIMQRAWAYKHDTLCTVYHNDFKGSLKAAWVDARLAMDEYRAQINPAHIDYPKPANDFRKAMIGLNPSLRYYDSSWR